MYESNNIEFKNEINDKLEKINYLSTTTAKLMFYHIQ